MNTGREQVFRPGALWRDGDGIPINAHGGGVLHEQGVYFWFGEHKIAGEAGNRAHVGVRCYSSRDLFSWKNEGVALAVSDEPGHELESGCIIERPKVIRHPGTGRYVMWFHLEWKDQGYSTARSGVAVSEHPAGPYEFCGSLRPNGAMARDMTLFVDDDGSAYHFYSSEDNRTMHVSKLSDDYLRPSGEFRRIFVDRKTEAPAVFKHDGRYWLIGSGCSGWDPNAARSAVAPNVWGPWVELGNPCRGEGADLTFGAQSTFVLPVSGRPGAFIFLADRWNPKDAIDGRYVWLPVVFADGQIVIRWKDAWRLEDLPGAFTGADDTK